ncbi:MAG TPA: phage holin family protein [Promineifilum sp.]|nr:phage holin family protein [Promineifilum sp.]
MYSLRSLLRLIIQFVVIWIVSALSLVVTAWILPGIHLGATTEWSVVVVAASAALILGIANLLIRPVILMVAIPLGFIAVFIVGLFVNSIMLLVTTRIVPGGLEVDGLLPAFVGGIVLSLVISLFSAILGIDDAGSFYERVIERRLSQQRPFTTTPQTNGLVMLEIDGLSYFHIHKAIAEGYMPNLEDMIEHDGYVLSRTDCGLPSQTSACQAGILFGDNYDIPAFRWYDKKLDKLFVSGSDAAEINARYAKGHGLLRGGASINNMVNGDATISLLTASDLRGGTDEQKRARADDVYLLLLNPNFLMRVIGLFFGEVVLEIWQYTRDLIRNTQPRLNRLHKFYPFVRAATTVFMREVSGFLTIMQIMRGEPAIYTTWPGYDEVAHHSGPWSEYAFGTLRGFDRLIGSVREILATKAPRPYELFILSDHGQSFGATFRMRYGYSLKDYIQGLMPEGTVMVQTAGGDDGSISVIATVAEIGNIRVQRVGGRLGQATVEQMEKAAERGIQGTQLGETIDTSVVADVTFCGSGNLAQVYFHAFKHRASLGELNAAFPGMAEAVIAHEGVGIVVAVDGEGVPIAFGKGGARNLHTGEVSGEDPLVLYGDPELRAWQARRLADFPSSGDLIIISTVYADGTVAAMEELIGNHGGLGGEQTDAFVLHPSDVEILPTRNSIDMFPQLNAQRMRLAKSKAVPVPESPRDDWALSNLVAGLRAGREWMPLALNMALFERRTYRAVATSRLMTGPAVLLSLVGVFVGALIEGAPADGVSLLTRFAGRYGLWIVSVLITHGIVHVLRGKGSFTRTFRAMGFAQTINLLGVLRLYSPIAPVMAVVVTVLSMMVTWLAVAEAHNFRGWRAFVLLALYGGVLIIGGSLLSHAYGDFRDVLRMMFQSLGFLP